MEWKQDSQRTARELAEALEQLALNHVLDWPHRPVILETVRFLRELETDEVKLSDTTIGEQLEKDPIRPPVDDAGTQGASSSESPDVAGSASAP